MRFVFWIGFVSLMIGCSSKAYVVKQLRVTENKFSDHTGFVLFDPSQNKTLIAYNEQKYFTPASNTKIFTFYTSLKLLGDSAIAFKYKIVSDSLLVWGMGDPSFLNTDVFTNDRAFSFLKNNPRKLYLSQSHFQTTGLGEGWSWDDYPFGYAPERSAVSMYGNLMAIQKNNSRKLIATPSFFQPYILEETEARTTEEVRRDIDANTLRHYPGQKSRTRWSVPIHFSSSLIASLLRDTLKRSVEVIEKPLLKDAQILRSVPLDSLLKVMMVESDNHIAEQLLLQCAAVVSDTLQPEIAIRYATKQLLADLPDAPQWVDGSGLSRFNLVTPRSIVHIWNKIYRTIPSDRLFKLLAVGGKSGTIKNWYKADVPYIYAKTGTLSNNHCLSGFIKTKKGKTLIFSMMSNNYVASTSELRKQMETILKSIYEKY
ncbi:MAG: D-alanyl-D-alanine carboxypeptidase/D-alanyl-D-alanine-endopeptidase [Cyclobacteriaceae bacterium]|nr:D-alanyl-D-alanine carboxypeptidase/D-alanyl-D-alanine-endopeptidase [Cyclobacteriaceae bacterium]